MSHPSHRAGRRFFNLEAAVATWRHLLAGRRAISAEDAEELEAHLRDEVEDLVAHGMNEEDAFRETVRRLGDVTALESAYRSVYWKKQVSEHRLGDELRWRFSMLKNYVMVALRTLRKQKGYSFINIAGLSVGLVCSFFILLWVTDELSYDRFHAHGDRLYRVLRNAEFGDQKYTWGAIPKPLAEALEAEYPEIEHAELMSWEQQQVLTRGELSFRETGFYAGDAFFEMFSFPLLLGDAETVIDEPNAIALSAALAEKLFGADWRSQKDLLGQAITVDHNKDFVVRGVFADVPENSTLQFDYVLPIQDFIAANPWVEEWGNNGLQLAVQLREGASGAAVTRKIEGIILKHDESASSTIFLQPFEDVRLYSDYRDWKLVGGRIDYVRLFTVVAVFLLVIASINFMNLATARSMQRAREIGVRKVVGADRRSLVLQFMGESLVISTIAFVLAMLLVLALLPLYNDLAAKEMGLGDLNPAFVLGGLGIALVAGLLSGSYPALYLSSFHPINVLRGTLRQRPLTANLRKALVVFQFALSILLIVGTTAVYRQVDYIRTKNLGLDRANIVVLPYEGAVREGYEAFRQELSNQPGIASVTTASQDPLQIGNSTTNLVWEGKAPEDNTLFHIINTGHDFIETMRMEVVQGRSFSRAFATDTANYVLNERAVQAIGLEDPVGKRLTLWEVEGQIVGVVKDFHMTSLHQAIEPTIIRLDPPETWRLFVRTRPGETEEALASLEAAHKRFNPDYPFEYRFMDQNYEETYKSEITMGKLANVFALVALFISCLGLFGLASFTTERRTKEIGIRRVLGASVPNLVLLLSTSFTKLVLVAFVLAAPVGYYFIDGWLDGFTYRAEIGYGTFVVAGAAALAIAWLTVSYQSIRAATANPVKSLRTE